MRLAPTEETQEHWAERAPAQLPDILHQQHLELQHQPCYAQGAPLVQEEEQAAEVGNGRMREDHQQHLPLDGLLTTPDQLAPLAKEHQPHLHGVLR
mmetsp:Transcript_74099/g.131028  ORF Transcript_74099/g.131028 Transcript_74099/m.131028 type:complete len:96 (+) Transcript_74099:470-757(+)